MKPGKLILIGVVVFVSTLIWQAPVAHLYGWVMGDRPSAVIARGLSGTPWNGQAAAISLDGKTVAQSLQWQFRPVQLLLGRFAVGIQSAADPIFSGELHLNFFGPISLHEVRAGGSIAELLSYFPNAALPADGQWRAQLQQVQLRQGFPVHAVGDLNISGLSFKLGRNENALGSYSAVLSNQQDHILAQISTEQGPLNVEGRARLFPDGLTYDVDLLLRALPDASPAVTNMLPTLGKPDRQGRYTLRHSGVMPGAAAAPT